MDSTKYIPLFVLTIVAIIVAGILYEVNLRYLGASAICIGALSAVAMAAIWFKDNVLDG